MYANTHIHIYIIHVYKYEANTFIDGDRWNQEMEVRKSKYHNVRTTESLCKRLPVYLEKYFFFIWFRLSSFYL